MLKFSKAIEIGTVRKVPNSTYWIVKEPFVFYIDYETKNEKIIVPEGFKTNFGSIPRFLWWLFNPTGFVSYVIHDYIYSEEGYVVVQDDTKISEFSKSFLKDGFHHWETYGGIDITTVELTRKNADRILDLGLEIEGMSKWKRKLVYIALRLFGGSNFKK